MTWLSVWQSCARDKVNTRLTAFLWMVICRVCSISTSSRNIIKGLEVPVRRHVHCPLRTPCERGESDLKMWARTMNFCSSTLLNIFSMGTECFLHHATVILCHSL